MSVGGCSKYGHACYGGHGKRSPDINPPIDAFYPIFAPPQGVYGRDPRQRAIAIVDDLVCIRYFTRIIFLKLFKVTVLKFLMIINLLIYAKYTNI